MKLSLLLICIFLCSCSKPHQESKEIQSFEDNCGDWAFGVGTWHAAPIEEIPAKWNALHSDKFVINPNESVLMDKQRIFKACKEAGIK